MNAEHYDLGPVPADETPEQLGKGYNSRKARFEVQVFIRQLIRTFGEPPEGCRLRVGSNLHDFGTYYEARIIYDSQNQSHCEYVNKLDSEYPEEWDSEANKELLGFKNPEPEKSKLDQLLEFEGLDLEDLNMLDSIVPGICMNVGCKYTAEVEPDCREGYCEQCKTQTVKSVVELLL